MLVLSLYELKIAHISLSICVFAYSPVSFDHMKYILFTLYFSIESSYNPLLMSLCTFLSHLQKFLVKVKLHFLAHHLHGEEGKNVGSNICQ